MFTASGTRPPFHSRVLMPNETAWEKLSWPRRMPDRRAGEVSIFILVLVRAYLQSSEMLSVMVERR